jgi:alpha-L-fucosidase
MSRSPTLSRRDWLAVTGATALDLLLARGAQAQYFDSRTPTQLDRDWLKATRAYAPERARLLTLVEQETRGGPFRPDWASLQAHATPTWYQDAKFGIFIHWGLYSIPAFGSEWYSRDMYVQGSPEFAHHAATYGPQSKFGYKDFIPLFTADHFDPSAWMALFRDAGARYVVPGGRAS